MLIEYTDDFERVELANKYPKANRGHPMCESYNDGWICTREKDHQPPHIAHGGTEEAYASWSDE